MNAIDPFAVRALLGQDAAVCRRAVTGEHGISLPPLHDHHVHAHLADVNAMPAHGIAAVVDLGGDPVALARRPTHGLPQLTYAGAFLTAQGGYPTGRPWAPDTIIHTVADEVSDLVTAVDEQAGFGATLIKVALHTEGPVFSATALDTILNAAHERGLRVVAHVQGRGAAALAIEGGVDVLAHAPFSERLDERLIAASAGQVWISTLAIHAPGAERDDAVANAAAFVAAGGRLVYGTDLGNGDQPLGVNTAELRALRDLDVRGPALVRTLTDPWPHTAPPAGVSTFIAGPPPASADLPEWLAGAVVVPAEELIHDD